MNWTYVLDDHDQEGQLDAQSLRVFSWTGDIDRGHVCAHDLEHGRLDVGVRDSLDVAVPDIFVPDLQGLGPDRRLGA